MGRKPTRWQHLPPMMRARPRGRKIFYYLDTGEKPRKEIPLGSDYVLAVHKWSTLTERTAPEAGKGTFPWVVERYWEMVIPSKAPGTQIGNEKERDWLLKYFGNPPAPLDQIEPAHIKGYMRWRVQETRKAAEAKNAARIAAGAAALPISPTIGQTRANREKALFSHIWNFAREEGYTKLPNPCQGVKGFREDGRDVLVDDESLAKVMKHATQPLRFALRLAHLTGQRPGDLRRMSEADLARGYLMVKQGKTGAKVRIVIEGELKALLEEMASYKADRTRDSNIKPIALLVNERGQALTQAMLRDRFDEAREAAGIEKNLFQFRDLRAKAATEADEADGTRAAQGLLGHATEAMTADYIRHKVGKKVRPLR